LASSADNVDGYVAINEYLAKLGNPPCRTLDCMVVWMREHREREFVIDVKTGMV
jgi:hypothetical protein